MTNIYLDGEYPEEQPHLGCRGLALEGRTDCRDPREKRLHSRDDRRGRLRSRRDTVELQHRYPHARLKGYDISPQAIEICREKENSALSFELADLAQSRDAHFDLLLAIDVIEHVNDYPRFLASVRDLADVKVFHIPLDMTVLNTIFKDFILKQRRTVGHIHYFMKETALAALEEAGYEIIDWSYTPGYSLPHDYGWKDRLLRSPPALLPTEQGSDGQDLRGVLAARPREIGSCDPQRMQAISSWNRRATVLTSKSSLLCVRAFRIYRSRRARAVNSVSIPRASRSDRARPRQGHTRAS